MINFVDLIIFVLNKYSSQKNYIRDKKKSGTLMIAPIVYIDLGGRLLFNKFIYCNIGLLSHIS